MGMRPEGAADHPETGRHRRGRSRPIRILTGVMSATVSGGTGTHAATWTRSGCPMSHSQETRPRTSAGFFYARKIGAGILRRPLRRFGHRKARG